MNRDKLLLRLEREKDGYPPVDHERLWIERVDENTAVVDNIPFFSREVALGDVVRFEEIGGELRYVSTLRRSGNSLVRVVYYPPIDPADLRRQIEELGCETELDTGHTLIAVSVPPGGALQRLQELLATGESKDELGYEEAILIDCTTPRQKD